MKKLPLLLAVASSSTLALAAEPRGIVARGAEAQARKIAEGLGTAQVLFDGSSGPRGEALSVLTLEPGAVIRPHGHEKGAEILYVEDGLLEVSIGGQVINAGKGDAVYIPAGVQHMDRNGSPNTDARVLQFKR